MTVVPITAKQQEEMKQHEEEDAHDKSEELAPAQQEQLEADLKRLLPEGLKQPPTGMGGRLSPAAALPPEQVEKFEPITSEFKLADLRHPLLATSGWKYRAYPKGGLVFHDKSSWMQRVDQGQDFEIPWGAHIIAPGWGHCVGWLHDRPFPSGFGSPYAVLYFGGGRFAGRLWYAGHMNYVQIKPGESFHAGRALGRLYNSLTPGRGWIEFGHAANGYPMSMGEGAKWHYLFTSPEWRWGY